MFLCSFGYFEYIYLFLKITPQYPKYPVLPTQQIRPLEHPKYLMGAEQTISEANVPDYSRVITNCVSGLEQKEIIKAANMWASLTYMAWYDVNVSKHRY